MKIKTIFKPYDVAEHEETENIQIVAFGEIVAGTPTYSPDDIDVARKLCDVLNTAYNAGAAGKGKLNGSDDGDPGYNEHTRQGP